MRVDPDALHYLDATSAFRPCAATWWTPSTALVRRYTVKWLSHAVAGCFSRVISHLPVSGQSDGESCLAHYVQSNSLTHGSLKSAIRLHRFIVPLEKDYANKHRCW